MPWFIASCVPQAAEVVENTHQVAKDSLRNSRHQKRSSLHKHHMCIKHSVLQNRGVEAVSVSSKDLSFAKNPSSYPSFRRKVTSTRQMHKEFTDMLLPKSKSHTWPSPAPEKHFDEVCATEWLMQQWDFIAAEGDLESCKLSGGPLFFSTCPFYFLALQKHGPH